MLILRIGDADDLHSGRLPRQQLAIYRRRWQVDEPQPAADRNRRVGGLALEILRRIEHQVFAVLKMVFLAVEDFGAMTAAVRDLATRVTSRRGSSSEIETTRAFLGWLLDNNYVFLGLAHYRSDGGTQLHAVLDHLALGHARADLPDDPAEY